MNCEFCDAPLPNDQAANLALLDHVRTERACNESYQFMIQNLNTSWTKNMSGG